METFPRNLFFFLSIKPQKMIDKRSEAQLLSVQWSRVFSVIFQWQGVWIDQDQDINWNSRYNIPHMHFNGFFHLVWQRGASIDCTMCFDWTLDEPTRELCYHQRSIGPIRRNDWSGTCPLKGNNNNFTFQGNAIELVLLLCWDYVEIRES